MDIKLKPLGQVSLVQLQPNGLVVDAPGKTSTGYIYDATRLVQVDQLQITPLGIEAINPEGEIVLDIHHMNHPGKEYGDDDLVCIGFTSHYDAMRAHFGKHMSTGIAGENIIIDYSKEVWPNDLNARIGIENQDNGEMGNFEMVTFTTPCVEFSEFCTQSQYEKVPASKTKEALTYLENGRRGYLMVLSKMHDVVTVRPGDKVFVLSD